MSTTDKKSFEEVLAETKEKVWPVVSKYLTDPVFPEPFAIPNKYSDLHKLNWQIVSDYPTRKGKYGRAALVLLSAGAMNVAEEKALLAAAAMQVSEDWILVHDDFEDESPERRGVPALQRIYGDKLAVNAGDILHTIMWKMLLDNKTIVGEEKGNRIMEEFYRMLMRTAFGQAVEIKWAQGEKGDFCEEDWFFIADGKTSYYTIALPLRLGAILGGASEAQLAAMAEFGQVLGRCFQLVDDILDVTSDFKGLKKQKGNDIYEGKGTLLVAYLLRNVDPSGKEEVLRILGKSRAEKSAAEVEWVTEKMREAGSIDYARKKAEELLEQAEDVFEDKLGFLEKEPFRAQLKAGMEFMARRDH